MKNLQSIHEILPNHTQAGAQQVRQPAQSVGDLCGDVLAAGRAYGGCRIA